MKRDSTRTTRQTRSIAAGANANKKPPMSKSSAADNLTFAAVCGGPDPSGKLEGHVAALSQLPPDNATLPSSIPLSVTESQVPLNVAVQVPSPGTVAPPLLGPLHGTVSTSSSSFLQTSVAMPATVFAPTSCPQPVTVPMAIAASSLPSAFAPTVCTQPVTLPMATATSSLPPFFVPTVNTQPATLSMATAVSSLPPCLASIQEQIRSLQCQLDSALQMSMPSESCGVNVAGALRNVPTLQASESCQSLPPLFDGTLPRTVREGRSMYTAKMLLDLPEFSGAPEEWPMFFTAYQQSSALYQYTNFENCLRLQKSLKGEARDSVLSLLIHPDNVSAVMEQLKCRFGRPEVLIRSQIQQIRSFPAIPDNALGKIVMFATKTQNMVAFLRTAAAEHHLSNVTLLEELVLKLPLAKRLEWAQHALSIKPYATIMDFSNWLKLVADVVSAVIVNESRSPEDSKRKVVLHAAEEHYTECPFCQGSHDVRKCKTFLAWKVQFRWKEVKKHGLCFSCLSSGHTLSQCSERKPCNVDNCQRRHHQLLHDSKLPVRGKRGSRNESSAVVRSSGNEAVLSCVSRVERTEVLFRVVPVVLYGPSSRVETYALFDEGSSVTMMDSGLVAELGLKRRRSSVNLSWYAGKSTREMCSLVDLHVSGTGKRRSRFALNNVYGVHNLNLPTQSLDKGLAAKIVRGLPIATYSNARPRILIGLDHCHLGLAEEVVELRENGPYAASTPLGWTVYGRVEGVSSSSHTCLLTRADSEKTLHDLVASYFETENFGVKLLPTIESKDDVRAKQMLKKNTVRMDDRYQTCLLWKRDDVELPDSYPMALNRLLGIERKMKRHPEFAAAYNTIISDYVAKGYARKLLPEEVNVVSPKTWYLPHLAVYNANKPGKVRLVFDAAAAVDGVSLNSQLLKGPQDYKPMPSVLFNFRIGAVAVCGDIKEMFHQILILPEDRDSQSFLWRGADESQPPEVYEMRVMTFGAACSPCSAHFVKVTNAVAHHEMDPRAIRSILDFHYVDDLVDSFDTPARAMEIVKQVREIHEGAGFELRNFSSNSLEVVNFLEGRRDTRVDFACDVGDEKLSTEKVLGVYWQPASDTFGFRMQFHKVRPSIINGDRLPTKREMLSVFMSVFDPLGFFCHFMINAKLIMREVWRLDVRWDEPLPKELRNAWSSWRQSLDRVVTLKIPRHYFGIGRPAVLELHTFVDASTDAFAAVSYWRSTCADGSVQVAFVCAKTKYSLLAIRNEFIEFRRFSSYERLRRATAWVLRFVRRCRRSRRLDESYGLTAEEVRDAELLLCQLSQEESFAEEISQLRAGSSLLKSSDLYKLVPYVDDDNVLRVYGRIDAASWLPIDTKRPIILSPCHPFTLLVVAYYHKEMKHQNFEATVCEIRRKFWIPRLRKILREVVGRCNVCRYVRAQPVQPLMGSLPEDRLTPYVRPFSYTELDYFGPIYVTIGRRHEKRWVALFTCLTIRAIHLEVAFDLSTDACILAIRNFINRRGVPVKIRSDNGKNFVGANEDAKRFSEVFDVQRVQSELSSKGVDWEFNCPHNPAEGGAWERMVQCVKRVLRHTLKESAPKEHTLYSILIEAENVVNSRPLTHLPVSCEEEEPLTPNHFLLGSANTARTPPGVSLDKPLVLRKQWRVSRQLRDHFWKRWIVEYLPTLTRRSKWCQRTKPLAVGDVVLICDPSVERKQWKRGRVEAVFKGRDDVVRRADIRTSTGVVRRPVSKLAVLDIE